MIYKKGRYYMAKFMWQGKVIRKSTRCTSAKDARTVEGKIRSELGKGNWGVLESKPRVTLAEFLREDFLPYTESKFQSTRKTRDYYEYGAGSLLKSDMAGLRLDEVTGQHAQQYAARLSASLKPTTINCGLRTLRRALALAEEWGKLDRAPKISLAKGEHQRERVLTEEERRNYLAACPQPWKDVATLMLGSGIRPGEAYTLRWEHVYLNGNGGMIQIVKGKSKAARRILPMVPAVFQAFQARHDAQGCPSEGAVFPTASASGHIEESSAKQWHAKALETLENARKEKPTEVPQVKPFEPYCLRHTFSTQMAPRCDVFTLARIMGHSSITITQRYCHAQADAIERAFAKMAGRQQLVTDGGHPENQQTESQEREELVTFAVSKN